MHLGFDMNFSMDGRTRFTHQEFPEYYAAALTGVLTELKAYASGRSMLCVENVGGFRYGLTPPILTRLLGGLPGREAIASVVTWLGLTLLYRLVPNTRVRWGPAARGALFAALLLELLRYGFGAYVRLLPQVNWVVYGSFGAALFFIASVQLAWWVVLLGCVVTYAYQYRAVLARTPELRPRQSDPWLALAVVTLLARRGKESRADLQELSLAVGAAHERVAAVLRPLQSAKIVAHRFGRYRLRLAPEELTVAHLFSLLESADPWLAGTDLADIGTLRREAARRERHLFADATIADLVAGRPPLAAEASGAVPAFKDAPSAPAAAPTSPATPLAAPPGGL